MEENFKNDVIEKRRHHRVSVDTPLQYRNLRNAAMLPAGSVARNISEGGICFNTSEFMSLACRLIVEITLPTIPNPVRAISKVAWIRKLPKSDQYELGNQFLEMTKEDRMKIMDFVKNTLGQNP